MDMVRNDKIGVLLDRRQEHDEFEIKRAINEFRSLHQQPDARREWDLQDPESLKKDKPARVNDDDPRCGPASLQKFDGEDLNSKARLRYWNVVISSYHDFPYVFFSIILLAAYFRSVTVY